MERLNTVSAVDKGITLWWRTLGKLPGLTYHQSEDYEWVSSQGHNGPERILNVRLRPDDTDMRIDRMIGSMKEGTLPSGIILTPSSTPSDIVERLSAKGLAIDSSCPCMTLELNSFAPAPLPLGIGVSAVKNALSFHEWANIVNTALFGYRFFDEDHQAGLLSFLNTRLYISDINGKPASACMVIWDGQTATVECVATLAEFRHKGLGSAVVSVALAGLKKSGVKLVTLRSEPDGVNLYTRLGFREQCRRTVASIQP